MKLRKCSCLATRPMEEVFFFPSYQIKASFFNTSIQAKEGRYPKQEMMIEFFEFQSQYKEIHWMPLLLPRHMNVVHFLPNMHLKAKIDSQTHYSLLQILIQNYLKKSFHLEKMSHNTVEGRVRKWPKCVIWKLLIWKAPYGFRNVVIKFMTHFH